MSTAAETREAVQAYPFLLDALRAGVLNFSAAARFLDIEDVDAGAAALRRLADELPDFEDAPPDVRVRMESGIGRVDPGEGLLRVGETVLGRDAGSWTAIIAEGELGAGAVARILARMAETGVEPLASGFDGDRLVIVTDRSDGPAAIRCVEETAAG